MSYEVGLAVMNSPSFFAYMENTTCLSILNDNLLGIDILDFCFCFSFSTFKYHIYLNIIYHTYPFSGLQFLLKNQLIVLWDSLVSDSIFHWLPLKNLIFSIFAIFDRRLGLLLSKLHLIWGSVIPRPGYLLSFPSYAVG